MAARAGSRSGRRWSTSSIRSCASPTSASATGCIAGGRGTYRSSDDGATWTRTEWPGTYLLGVRARGVLGRVRVVGEGGIVLQSDDGAATWGAADSVGFGQLWAIDFGAPGSAAFACGSGGLVARRAPH